jgi:hypothetical protein
MSGVIRIGRSRDEFLGLVADALSENDPDKAAARQAAVKDGTWDARAEWVSDLIESKLKERSDETIDFSG